jgi:hypothetical protein
MHGLADPARLYVNVYYVMLTHVCQAKTLGFLDFALQVVAAQGFATLTFVGAAALSAIAIFRVSRPNSFCRNGLRIPA